MFGNRMAWLRGIGFAGVVRLGGAAVAEMGLGPGRLVFHASVVNSFSSSFSATSSFFARVKKAVPEEQNADVIRSTAHKAKGREWDAVRLAPDFMNSRLGPGAEAQAEVRLFYVAMTAAHNFASPCVSTSWTKVRNSSPSSLLAKATTLGQS